MHMTRRQKILLPLTLFAFALLLWQVMVVFFPDAWARIRGGAGIFAVTVASDSVSADEAIDTAAVPQQSQLAPAQTLSVDVEPGMVQDEEATVMATEEPLPTTAGNAPSAQLQGVANQPQTDGLMAPITASQQQYVRLANAYQLAKMQRMLAEEETAVAEAKSKLQQLAKSWHGAINDAWQGATASTQTEDGYRLVYLDGQEGADWVATLQHHGHYWAVQANTVLANGDKVLRIDHRGVLLAHGQQEQLVS